MRMEHKKTKISILVFIALVSLLELKYAYYISREYAGVYEIGISIPLILQPLYYYRLLFKEQKTSLRLRIIVMGSLSVVLPLVIYFTLPNYTYKQGKQIVKEYVQVTGKPIFVDIPRGMDTVTLINNPKRLFVSDRAYCYEIKSTGENKYFLVNPITGEVYKMKNKYWP
ncbi:hypothetical protein SH2C18_45990 [Clostridium sediminicola]|uniref:hypothetical protein n=1 Tax=Clostridium sediminicola TaxID=3114879 RepID=UPI0031F1DF99